MSAPPLIDELLYKLSSKAAATFWVLVWSALRLVVASAGIVPVPPIRASGIQSLLIKPTAPTIAISIAGPPPTDSNSDCNEAVVEVIVKVVVMGEVVVVVRFQAPL